VSRWDCTSQMQLTHSLKPPGSNLRACPLAYREKPVTNFALSLLSHATNVCRYSEGSNRAAGIFVKLPPEVAAMGAAGVSISCMSLAKRRGVWRPVAGDVL
jgi:hypothetical protein